MMIKTGKEKWKNFSRYRYSKKKTRNRAKKDVDKGVILGRVAPDNNFKLLEIKYNG